MKTYEIVDSLQSVREQISALQEREKSLADGLKDKGLGRYSGTVADCSVIEVETNRVNVAKLIKRLDINQHAFNRYYMTKTTSVRATIVNKQITAKVAA